MRRSRHCLPLAVLLTAGALSPTAAHAGAPPASALVPTADVFVSSSQPRRNFGVDPQLRIARRPARRALVRFELGGALVRGSRVRLYLYPLTSAKRGVEVSAASARDWSETAATYRASPRPGRRKVRSGPLHARRWKSVDVTRLVGGRSVVTLALTTTGGKRVVLASREAGDRAPRLLAAVAGPVAEPPAPAPALPPAPSLPAGPPTWRGDLETGDFSQWKQLDGNLAQRDRYFGVVSAPFPVAQGRYAFRSTVDGGATVSSEAGQRSMVLLFPERVASNNATGAFEGSERWYRTHIYFPADFKASPNNSWNWLVQWHNWPNGPCCANLAITVDTRGGRESLSMRVMGGGDSAHPAENNDMITEKNPASQMQWFVGDPAIRRGHWYDSVTHVKWSADGTKGLVEWWLDGRLIASKTMPTLFWYRDNNSAETGATPGPGQAYYMEGYYRPATLPNGQRDTSVATVYFDGAELGPSAQSVSGP